MKPEQPEPVPGEGAAHDVAADDAQGSHHLERGKNDIFVVP